MVTDLERAFEALNRKQSGLDMLWRYYDGDQPLVYSAQRLQQVFNNLDARFSENWCAVVVDTALERIQLSRFVIGGDDALTARLNELWTATQLDLDADDAHLGALVCGESYVIAWPGETGGIDAYYNDARLCHIEYRADNPHYPSWAAKWWVDEDGIYCLTLYYSDRLEYYRATAKDKPQAATAFQPMDPPSAPNPFGQVPVFHLRRERRAIRSELANVAPLQDAVNKLLSDMMVAAEFGAFRQRWIISNADVKSLKNAPNEIWSIPAGDGAGQQAAVGEFSPTELANYIGAIDRLATAIGVISRTPRHYFFQQGGDPSGEALIAMEAPLTRKVGRYIARFGNTWQRVAAFLLTLDGTPGIDPETIQPVFAPAETVQPRTRAEIRQFNVAAGVPLTTTLRGEGWTDAQLAQLADDRAAEQAAAQQSLAQALLAQQRRFDQEQ